MTAAWPSSCLLSSVSRPSLLVDERAEMHWERALRNLHRPLLRVQEIAVREELGELLDKEGVALSGPDGSLDNNRRDGLARGHHHQLVDFRRVHSRQGGLGEGRRANQLPERFRQRMPAMHI